MAAVDNNSEALDTHQENHPETDHYDIEIGIDDIDFLIEKYKPDVVIGSPPCQNFSTANTTNKDEKEGMRLMNEFLKFVKKSGVKYWVGENVRGVKTYLDRNRVPGLLLNSVDFGVPQKRIRYFFGNYPKPQTSHCYNPAEYRKTGYLRKPWVTIKDILSGPVNNKTEWMEFDDLPKTAKKRVVDYEYQKKPRMNFYKMVDPEEPHGVVPAHVDVSNLLVVSSANSNSNSNGSFVKTVNNPSWTATTRQNFFLTNGIKFRRFTNLELKRLMGFPDNYQILGSRTAKIRQLGNAVTPPVAKALGQAILDGRPQLKKQESLEAFF